ncbi:hypothetical protein LINPERPRIM_LOCUS4554 [Linum perenne]
MRLRPEFEQVRSRLISDNKMDMDDILGELLRAETRFVTQAQLDGTPTNSAFAVGRPKPRFVPQSATSSQGSNTKSIKCNFCQEIGHPQSLCRQRNICSYCKKSGHIIVDCRAPGRKNFGNTRPSGTSYATSATVVEQSSSPSVPTGSTTGSQTDFSHLIREELARILPQALSSAFSTLGITGSADQGESGNSE